MLIVLPNLAIILVLLCLQLMLLFFPLEIVHISLTINYGSQLSKKEN